MPYRLKKIADKSRPFLGGLLLVVAYQMAVFYTILALKLLPLWLAAWLWPVLPPLAAFLLLWSARLGRPVWLRFSSRSPSVLWLQVALNTLLLFFFSLAVSPWWQRWFAPLPSLLPDLPSSSRIVASVLTAPLAEELVYRGGLDRLLGPHFRPAVVTLVTATLFAVSHQLGAWPAAWVAGLLLMILYRRSGLLVAGGVHAGYNALVLLVPSLLSRLTFTVPVSLVGVLLAGLGLVFLHRRREKTVVAVDKVAKGRLR